MLNYEISQNKIIKMFDGYETLYLKFLDEETFRIYS